MPTAWRCLLLASWLAVNLTAAEAPAEPPPPLAPEAVTALVARLGDADYRQREAAQQALSAYAVPKAPYEPVLAAILAAYLDSTDPEVRFRGLEIMQRLVIVHLFNEAEGHLGLALRTERFPERIDGQFVYPLHVRYVAPRVDGSDAPMEVVVGDRIVRIGDRWLTRRFSQVDLAYLIRTTPPGTLLTFTVLNNGQRLERRVTVDKRPESPDDPPVEDRQDSFFRDWLRDQIRQRQMPAATDNATDRGAADQPPE